MHLLHHAKEGLLNLYFSKLRALLALLGVLVGTASVVAMVLGGELATNEALKQFKSLGTDLLAVSIYTAAEESQANNGKAENLTLEQAQNILSADASIVKVAPYTQIFNPLYFEGQKIPAMVLGVTEDFADITRINLAQGRFISTLDNYQFYCVIGHDVYMTIKKYTHKSPIGQQLQMGKNIFVIIGVAEPWPENSFVYANIDHAVLIPMLASMVVSKYATINTIIMRLRANADISRVENNVTKYINAAVAKKTIHFRSAKELIVKMGKQNNILTVFLGLIGSISLVVGGIGVMNIMLVSVMERRKEIGIRLAVGAKRRDIALLFLMEAVMLSLLGGVLGVLIGILIAYIIALFWHWEFTLFLWPPLAGFSVSVAVGIFFGFYPAYLASKLSPIEALRSD
jgi:putative ABC transport system permease protein